MIAQQLYEDNLFEKIALLERRVGELERALASANDAVVSQSFPQLRGIEIEGFWCERPAGADFLKISTGDFVGDRNVVLVYTDGTVKVTNTDVLLGAVLELHGINSAPADNDVGALLRARARDDAGGDIVIGDVYFQINDVSAGVVKSSIIFMLQEGGADTTPLILKGNNIGVHHTDFGGGAGVIGIKNASSNPGATPSGGGVLYVDAGALKYKGSSGTVTTVGPA